MKFRTFDSTLWAHLPRDFAENEDTAWVTCPNSLFGPQRGPDVYHQYINQLAYADQLGFDGVVINEHHQERLKQHNHISSLMTKRTEVPRRVPTRPHGAHARADR